MQSLAAAREFVKLASNFIGGEGGVSEEEFEKRASLYCERVHHCLLFPKQASAGSAFYSECETLFCQTASCAQNFNKRTPTGHFRLLESRDMRTALQDGRGVYSFGPYLDDANELTDGLLLAHLFVPRGEGQELAAEIARQFAGLRHGFFLLDAFTVNLFCVVQ